MCKANNPLLGVTMYEETKFKASLETLKVPFTLLGLKADASIRHPGWSEASESKKNREEGI